MFVPLALPGEQARVRIVEESAATRRPKWKRLLRRRRSGSRRVPALWRMRRLPVSARGLRSAARDSSRRFCARRWSAAACARRMRLRCWPASRGPIAIASGSRSMRRAMPGYRGRRSHAVVPIAECPIAAPLLVRAALAAGGDSAEVAGSGCARQRFRSFAMRGRLRCWRA